ncbi:MAG: CPBP family intramembrane metalloprotease [Promethearchaeota archaeon]|nr:MAG: CPBP family intramembrane metalloprotease [Candidatus Lokiarchaeota archaeon]
MSKENERKIKYCVYCGTQVQKNKTYCPNCGKLIIKIKPEQKISKSISHQKIDISRKCKNCGSIITSTILDQCPICNTALEKISEAKRTMVQKKPGLIFTSKKLEPEHKFILKKDTWNLKEGINVFGTCIYILVIVFFLLYFLTTILQLDLANISIELILWNQIPGILFGLYPIWYIYNKKHSYIKLGFYSDSKKFVIAIFIGILGTILLLLIEFFSSSLINFFSDIGLDFFDIKSSIEAQNLVIRNTDLLWIIFLTLMLCVRAISTEIVFRGVFHNTLKQRFRNDYYVVMLVALAYSLMMLLFTFPIGIGFFLLDFLVFIMLGLLYSINGNILNTIIANISFNIILIILIVL